MNINEFLTSNNLHDSLVTKIEFFNNTVNITMDFCYWMQPNYNENDPETGIIHLVFPNVYDYTGLSGKIDDFSILEAKYINDEMIITLLDDFNNKSYLVQFTSVSGQLKVERD